MYRDKSLGMALLISTFLHRLLFLPLPYTKHYHLRRNMTSLNISYVLPEEIPVKLLQNEKSIVSAKKKTGSENQNKNNTSYSPEDKAKIIKKTVVRSADKDKKIEIPPELPKGKEPLYLDYYQSIREKIRKLVEKNYPRYIDCGDVCLYFVLMKDGVLTRIKVVEERSTANPPLREIAKRSVLQASPFSAFPKELSQEQLSFNVIISFELEK